MRNKRKSNSILQISKEKRQALSWNYLDTTNTNGCTSQSKVSRKKSSPSSSISHTGCICRGDDTACPPFYIPTSVYDQLHVGCDYGIGVFWNGYSSESHDVIGTLCQMKLFLSANNMSSSQIHPSYEVLPETLPNICATLMVFPDGFPSRLIFDDENVSQSSTSLCIHSKRYYLCFEASIKDQSIPLESLEYLCRGDKNCRLRLEVREYCPQESTVSIHVLLLQRIVAKQGIPISYARSKEEMRHKQQLLAYSHGFPVPAVPNNKKLKRVNFADLFQHIHEAHQREAEEEQDANSVVQHEKLIPLLRPYQVNAVRWMMKKELVGQEEQGRELHELWKTFTTIEGKTFYYNPFSAQISEEFHPKLAPSPGGILADEMGLGKTVEVLACILNHPRPLIQLATDRSDDSLEALSEHLDDSGDPNTNEAKILSKPDPEMSPPSESLVPPSDQGKKDEASSEDDVGMDSQEGVCSGQSVGNAHLGTDLKDGAVIEDSFESKDSLDTISSEGKESGCASSSSERMQDEDTPDHLEKGMRYMETKSQVNFIITSLVNEMCDQVERIHAASASVKDSEALERETVRLDGDTRERESVEMEASGNDCQNLGRIETQDFEPKGEAEGVYLPSSTFNKTSSCKMEVEDDISSSPKDLAGANDSGFVEDMEDEHSDPEADSSFEAKINGNEEIVKSNDAVVDLQADHGAENREGCSILKREETGMEVVDFSQMLGLEGATSSASSDGMRNAGTDSKVSDFNIGGHEKILQNDEEVKSKETGSISDTGMVEMQALSDSHVGEDGKVEGSSTPSSKMDCGEEAQLQPNGIVSTISEERRSKGDVQEDGVMEAEETKQDNLLPVIAQFACLCGKVEDEVREGDTIQCEECSGWQHAKCVNWKIQDPMLRSSSAVRYLCPHCQLRQPPTKSSATLIVSPSSICQQWVDEINRHIHSFSLKILVYQGVKKHRFLQPSFLAKHDIVITTYDILKQELHYVDLPHCNSDKERKLRHAKRYMAVPSPLPAVEWWRVCLDEAQMVECHTAKAAEMALRLSAVNRWCVTGTPVQRGLNDLYGLFLFLNEDPYHAKFWWEHALCAPFANGDQEPMLKFLTKKLWRTAKKDVLDQINIPSQTEEVHWLKFSPVEAHFYKRKRQGCAFDFTRALDRTRADPSMKLSDLDRETLHRLVYPLLRLRQACCHPQAVRGEFIRFNQTTMCMEDLLQSLIAKARLECEEAQRLLVCAINGQAATHMMEGEIVQAVEKYREVLRTSDEQKGKLKVDSLQLYHTIHNLKEILGEKHEGVAPTTRDSQLNKQMKELEEKYMSKALNNLTACGQTLFPISEKISSLQSKVSKGPGWWLDAVQYFMLQGLGDELVMKIKEDVMSGKMDLLTNRFQDCTGLQFVLQEEIDTLMKCFEEAKAGVKSLSEPVTPQLVAATVDCHLRPFKGRAKNDCPFCKIEGALQEYEMRLFAFEQKDYVDALTADVPSTSDADENNIGNYTIRPRGTWAMSELHKILKSLHAFLKQNYGDPWTIQEGTDHLELIEQMKKEFKPLRAYWGALLERVAAMDELDMAKMRLRAKLPDEPYDPVSQPYIIIPAEIPNQKMKLLNDRFVASSELRKKMGQLVYLENLEKAQYTLEGTNPDPCPICTRPLGAQWAVLHCGHCFCCECMSVLQSRCPSASMRCPVCRQKILRSDISFVSTKAKNEESSQTAIRVKVLEYVRQKRSTYSTPAMKGGYSTKVEAVVKALIQIRRNDPTAKSLVFSAWQEVLNIISKALADNNVTHRQISQVGHKHFQSKILDFKLDEDISTLLLPLNVACNGLNIIEATHVLLVEPILNPATELQAVGRVHRIGQTRPTIIHRFLVQQTIEEELHKYLLSNPISNNIGSEVSETGELTVAELRGMLSFLPDNVTD